MRFYSRNEEFGKKFAIKPDNYLYNIYSLNHEATAQRHGDIEQTYVS